jgi:hypothetical protein
VAFERVSRIARAPLVEHIPSPSLASSVSRLGVSTLEHFTQGTSEGGRSREPSHWFLAQRVQHQGLRNPQGTIHGVREKSPSHAWLCEYCTFCKSFEQGIKTRFTHSIGFLSLVNNPYFATFCYSTTHPGLADKLHSKYSLWPELSRHDNKTVMDKYILGGSHGTLWNTSSD